MLEQSPQALPGRRKPRKRAVYAPRTPPDNVIMLHQRFMPRHAELLARWLEAGRRMGLCDASTFAPDPIEGEPADILPPKDYVLVWVRENIDPAYMVIPDRADWVVVDAVRQQNLARVSSFAAALQFIRPVLPLEAAA